MCNSKENERIHKAASLLGINRESIFDEELIKRRYKIAIKYLHPDNWINENDPDILRNATVITTEINEAFYTLIKNLKRSCQ